MTVSTSTNKFRYEGNGSTDTFAFNGRIFNSSDIVVEIILRADDSLVETLTITTDYTVTINSPESASVTVVGGKIPTSLQDIQLRRSLTPTQTLDLPTGTVFPAVSVENALDRNISVTQDLSEKLDRTITLSATSNATVPTLGTLVADEIIQLDSGGTQLISSGLNSVQLSALNGISADITTVAGISANVTTVANNDSNITTVAGISSDVTTVAGISSDVTTVAADGSDIGIVASDIASVNTAASNIAAIIAAPTEAANAAASALAAQTALESIGYSDVVNVSFADSPYSIEAGNVRNFFSVDTSGGDVVFNINASLAEPFSFRVKKDTSDANTVTVNTLATETFADGTTSKVITSIGGIDCQLDTSTSPDTWKTASFGAVAGEQKKQQFTRTATDFTTGTTSLTLTNTPLPPSSAGLSMNIDGIDQHTDAFTYDPDTGIVTFDALDASIESIEFTWGSGSLAIGTTGDGTVSFLKFASGLFISSLSEVLTTATSKIARISDLFDYVKEKAQIQRQTTVTLSGSSYDFTGIPSDVNRVTVVCSDLASTTLVTNIIQIGDSGGIEETGYRSSASYGPTGNQGGSSTTGFLINPQGSTGTGFDADFTFTLNRHGDKWVYNSFYGLSTVTSSGSGTKQLTGDLTQLRIKPSSGTLSGTATISWEF